MTFSEIDVYCRGYETRMAKIKEVPRVIAAILLNVNRKQGAPVVPIESVFPLYTDKKEKKELMSKEEFLNAQKLKVKWQDQN